MLLPILINFLRWAPPLSFLKMLLKYSDFIGFGSADHLTTFNLKISRHFLMIFLWKYDWKLSIKCNTLHYPLYFLRFPFHFLCRTWEKCFFSMKQKSIMLKSNKYSTCIVLLQFFKVTYIAWCTQKQNKWRDVFVCVHLHLYTRTKIQMQFHWYNMNFINNKHCGECSFL